MPTRRCRTSLNDRELDGWRPLLAIADMAGGDWREAARDAAVALSEGDDDHDDEPALMLLADCRTIFDEKTRGRPIETTSKLEAEITSAKLVEKLHGLTDRPWLEWGRLRKPISCQQRGAAAETLRHQAGQHRHRPEQPSEGLRLVAQFDDAWQRYGGGA